MPLDNFVVISGNYGQPEPWEIKPPRKLVRNGSTYWVPPGQSVSVAGRTIDGMVYVGSDLGSVSTWTPGFEPALILPNAPVQNDHPDIAGAQVPFRPSYAKLHPQSRAAYLDWLAAGRPAGAPDRYVGLFVYGLERRILHDAVKDETARAEIPALLQEIDRLADLYPEFAFAFDYLSRLKIAVQLANGSPLDPNWAIGLIEWEDWEMPPLLRVVLGQFVAAREPIPAQWALLWYLCHPDTRRRAAVDRCPEQFEELFELIYRDRFGDGIAVKTPRHLMDGYYHYPSSPSFGSSIFITTTNIPDVSRVKKPVGQLNEVADLAIARLTPLSRAIGSGWRPASAATLALYPPELALSDQIPAIVKLKSTLDKTLGTQSIGNLQPGPLLELFPEFDQPPSTAQLRSMGNLLNRLGFGLEPNPATARAEFNAAPALILFRVDPAEPESDRVGPGLIALVDLGRHVANQRGASSIDGLQSLIASLAIQFGLSPNDTARLHAYLTWAHDRPVSLSRLRKPLQSLDPQDTRAVAPLFFSVGEGNAPLGNAEITFFGKVYTALGLDQQRLHSDVHTRSAGRAPIDLLPRSGASARTGVLDHEQVRAVRKETDEVAYVLHDVFGASYQAETPATPAPLALDIYTALLPILATRPSWSMTDLRTLTEFAALPLAGAIETINDRAAALGLDPLLDCDDETCDVHAPTLKGLLAAD